MDPSNPLEPISQRELEDIAARLHPHEVKVLRAIYDHDCDMKAQEFRLMLSAFYEEETRRRQADGH